MTSRSCEPQPSTTPTSDAPSGRIVLTPAILLLALDSEGARAARAAAFVHDRDEVVVLNRPQS